MAHRSNPKYDWYNGNGGNGVVAQSGQQASRSASRSQNFIEKLQEVLGDERERSFIHWDSEGRSIIIPDRNEFTAHVLEKLCQSKDFEAFTRQLNNYGFRKIISRSKRDSTDKQRCEFVHEYFRRDRPVHYSQIRRKSKQFLARDQEGDMRSFGSPVPMAAGPSQPAVAFAAVPLTVNSEIDELKRRLKLMEDRLERAEALTRQALYHQNVADAHVATLTAQIAGWTQGLVPQAGPLRNEGKHPASFQGEPARPGWSTDARNQSIPDPAAFHSPTRDVDRVVPVTGPAMPNDHSFTAMPQLDFRSGRVLDTQLAQTYALYQHLQNGQNQDLAAFRHPGAPGKPSVSTTSEIPNTPWPVTSDGSGGAVPAYVPQVGYVRPEHPPRGPAGGTFTA